MGEKLVVYFEKANEKGGLEARVKLAMLTQLSKEQAKDAPDSSENIKKFDEALASL